MQTENAERLTKDSTNLGKLFSRVRVSFRSLRWRLTLSYSLVTVAALLVVELVAMVIVMSYFVNNIDLTPENLISNLRAEWTPMVQQFFSEEPPDIEGVRDYLDNVQGSAIGTRPLTIFGNLQVQMKAEDFLSFYYLLNDRTLVDVIPHDIVPEDQLGQKIPYDYLPGLEKPLRAALDGIEDENLLYEKFDPGNRITGVVPVFRYEPHRYRSDHGSGKRNGNGRGTQAGRCDRFYNQAIPLGVLTYWRCDDLYRAVLLTFFAGILGSIFGMLTASGMTKRLTKVSKDHMTGHTEIFRSSSGISGTTNLVS